MYHIVNLDQMSEINSIDLFYVTSNFIYWSSLHWVGLFYIPTILLHSTYVIVLVTRTKAKIIDVYNNKNVFSLKILKNTNKTVGIFRHQSKWTLQGNDMAAISKGMETLGLVFRKYQLTKFGSKPLVNN